MASYAHAHKAQGGRLNLSFLATGLRYPWVSITFLVGFFIEALLATRLWLQLNDSDFSGIRHILMTVTDVLVSPFTDESKASIQDRANGIFEYSTLVAVEVYLLAILAIVAVIVVLRFAVFGVSTGIALKRWNDRRSARRTAESGSRTAAAPRATYQEPQPPASPRRLAGTRIAATHEREVTHR